MSMHKPSAVFALLVLLGGTSVAEAATLRAEITPHGPLVKLSDLFAGLLPGQDCDIGPAPSPGQRQIVPASQVQAIASQFGVELPDGAVMHAVSIQRPARTVQREEVSTALKAALATAGAPPDSDISLGVFASLELAADNTAAPIVSGLNYDPQSGRFSASLQFASPDDDTRTIHVTGRVEQMVESLVLKHALPAGFPVTAADVAPARVRRTALRGTPVTDIAEFAGLVTRQPMPAGMSLTQDGFLRPMLVARGRPVVLRLSSGGLALTAGGTALEAGGAGDRIHVMNSATRAILIGTVAGASDVMVDPGTAPVFSNQPALGAGQLPRLVADTTSSGLPQLSNSAQEAR
ncbi:flagellar basal body P-ring formation chaperone FlgA [Acetobacteraceae bacterium KSS8]|uniref:Flagellar basal body P-ring formation chaperone FlgA n=1 Tax=Endosaccharibacter trunci TaxID=2812733 RepID=A0ABT1W9V5_9PROT|nr:flagellar basal body P-ring formation chaperone FlgA [Acetobacteraceae bacterium KSS8]